jgi:hypothetical protein
MRVSHPHAPALNTRVSGLPAGYTRQALFTRRSIAAQGAATALRAFGVRALVTRPAHTPAPEDCRRGPSRVPTSAPSLSHTSAFILLPSAFLRPLPRKLGEASLRSRRRGRDCSQSASVRFPLPIPAAPRRVAKRMANTASRRSTRLGGTGPCHLAPRLRPSPFHRRMQRPPPDSPLPFAGSPVPCEATGRRSRASPTTGGHLCTHRRHWNFTAAGYARRLPSGGSQTRSVLVPFLAPSPRLHAPPREPQPTQEERPCRSTPSQ